MICGSWAPLIIFLENIGVSRRCFAVDYNGKQRFQNISKITWFLNFKIEGWSFLTCGSWAPLLIFLEHIGDLGRGLGLDYNLICRFKITKKKYILEVLRYPRICEQFPVIYAHEMLGCTSTGNLKVIWKSSGCACCILKNLRIQKLENMILFLYFFSCTPPPFAPPPTPLMAKMRN